PGTAPAGIALDDFVEAVMRGVARAQAGEDDVSGYAFGTTAPLSFGTGFVVYCPVPPPSDPRPVAPRPDRLSHGD
ncbi:MAG: hypothetical protein ACRDJE_20210, partial [Dehalococcoidia bacterium]